MSDTLYARAQGQGPSRSSPEDDLLAVRAFLHKTLDYAAKRELPTRTERFLSAPTPEHAAKLHQWTTWIAFVEHALREIEEGTLDSWFMPESRPLKRDP